MVGIDPNLDHIVYATNDLERTASAFERATGVAPRIGGRHPVVATKNAVVGLGPGRYIEIIGPDPDLSPADGVQRPFGIDSLPGPRLVGWALRSGGIDEAAAASARAGADLGPVVPMQRLQPDGRILRWRMALPTPLAFSGAIPFLIDWGNTPHPSARPLPQLRLVAFRATSPEPKKIARVLAALGAHLDISPGPCSLRAEIQNRSGRVVVLDGGD